MFIVIEGIEGAGKSSVQNGLGAFLSSRGKSVVLTREPGGTELGKDIRKLLLAKRNEAVDPNAELLLFAADRAQHITSVIRPALAAGSIVICDRFTFSTIAYQGFGRGLSHDMIERLNNVATDGLLPDLVLLLDLPVETGLMRAKKRADLESPDSWTRFESEAVAFHQKIRDGFLQLANQHTTLFEIIDATNQADVVLEHVCEIVSKRFAI